MILNAPFRRRSSRQAVLDLYTGRDMHVCADPHIHIFSPQDWGQLFITGILGEFLFYLAGK